MTPTTSTSACRSAALPRSPRRPTSTPWAARSMPPRPTPPATTPPCSNALAELDGLQVPGVLTAHQRPELLGLLQLDGAGRAALHEQLPTAGRRRQSPRRQRVALAEACDVACDATAPGAVGRLGRRAGRTRHDRRQRQQPAPSPTMSAASPPASTASYADDFLAGVTVGYTDRHAMGRRLQRPGLLQHRPGRPVRQLHAGPGLSRRHCGLRLQRQPAVAQHRRSPAWRRASPPARPAPTSSTASSRAATASISAAWRRPSSRRSPACRPTPARRTASPRPARSRSTSPSPPRPRTRCAPCSARSSAARWTLGWREKLDAAVPAGLEPRIRRHVAAGDGLFAGAPSAPFTTFGASPQRDGAVIGFALNTGDRRGDLALPALRGRHLRPGFQPRPHRRRAHDVVSPAMKPPWMDEAPVRTLLAALGGAGIAARFVGGCVRDWLLGPRRSTKSTSPSTSRPRR